MRSSLLRFNRPFTQESFPMGWGNLGHFDKLFSQFENLVTDDVESRNFAVNQPATDIAEDENRYLFLMDLPGVVDKDVDVKLNEGVLTVTGTRAMVENSDVKTNLKLRRSERNLGLFERRFRLPEDANLEKIEAKFKDGVLTIEVAKIEPKKPKSIEIKS